MLVHTKLNVKKAVVLGATGGMGCAIVERLLHEGISTVAFARSLEKLAALRERMLKLGYNDSQLRIVQGDIFQTKDIIHAASETDVIYQSAMVPYSEWKVNLIPMAESVIEAARTVNARIVVIDNIYAYGRSQQTKVDESHPKQPHTRKGKYRLQMEQRYIEARGTGVQSAIFHLPDFYGPWAINTSLHYTLAAIAAGKPSRFVGSQQVARQFIYTPDAAKAIVSAAGFSEAYDQQWNIPGAGMITGEEIVRYATAAAHSTMKVGTVSKMMLRFVGLFQPQLREAVEMFYLNEQPLILSGDKYERQFGTIPATPYIEGIRDTVQILREYGEDH